MTPLEKAKAARLSFNMADTQTESERRDVEALEKAAGVVYCYPYGHKPIRKEDARENDNQA